VSGMSKTFLAGFVSGAGFALFVLYVLSQAVPIDLERWPRLAVGVMGLALLAVGFVLRPRLRKPIDRTDAS
jgi:hypothetical protein